MSGIHAVLILLAGAGTSEMGFQFWADGQPVVGTSEGTMQFWADGQPEVIEED